ncbi:flavin-containing monooxygenase [Streptomyces sp. NPDC050433]|uniref:flavin-containing monooxygenase n=1 Tax=Streptomyces sp. NPDC050433 TaxID=3365615 RepID=UPI00378BF8BE
MNDSRTVDAVVVGAGFAGLYQLHRFRQLGLTTRVFEAGDDIGGTWFWNRYPGARCDIPGLAYSYSFSPELEQEWTWTEKYPPQSELLRYINHVADHFDLRRDITLSTRVTAADYDGQTGRWRVTTDSGETVGTRFLVMATGCLSVPKLPEVPGLDVFQGATYHTGQWPHEGVDFTGLRVAVVGTGSSGVQSIPLIAAQAAEVTVFQRTPAYVLPAYNEPLGQDVIDAVKADYPGFREAGRNTGYGVATGFTPTKSALEVSEEERTANYQEAWDSGMLTALLGGYTDLLTDKKANDTAAEFVRQKIRERVTDPEVAEALSPYSYPLGTKRPCLDIGYYETYNEPHVHLVDLRKTPLVELTTDGVRTSDREYPVDAVVFATGYDAVTGALNRIDIRGRDGQLLRDKWTEGPRSYLGLTVAGFPNLFTITGPSSPSVLSNVIVSIEQHVDLVCDLIAHLREEGHGTVEPQEEAEDQWVAHVAAMADATLYPSADSWYVGANVPGKPRVFMAYVGGVGTYREHCKGVVERGYEGFRFSGAA